MRLSLLFFLAWLTTAELVGTTDPCPTNRIAQILLHGQSCYEFDSSRVSWTSAQRSCQQRGGRLVFVPNAETKSWLGVTAVRLWPNQDVVWIGLKRSMVGGTATWDNYNGTGLLGSFYNWQSERSTLLSGCVAMHKNLNWKWTMTSCLSSYFAFVCEYPAAMMTSATVLTNSTEPMMLSNRSSSAGTNAPSDLWLITVSADATVEKDREKDLVLTLSTSICVVSLVIAAVLSAVFVYIRKRHSKRLKSAAHQDIRTTQVRNNPSYDYGLGRDCPAPEPNRAIEELPNSGYTCIGEMPTTEIATYEESFDDVGHTYAEPLEPWLSSGGINGRRTTPNGSGSTDGHVDIAHTESAPTVIYANGVPKNADSSTAVLTDDVYVEVDPLLNPCSNADRRPPCSSDVYRFASDCRSNECLPDTYAIE